MKKILLSFAALAALVSCVKENPVGDENVDSTPAQTQSISFEAVAPSSSDEVEAKTTLVNHSLVHWSKGDQVKVLFLPQVGWGATLYEAEETVGANAIMTSTFDSENSESAFFYVDNFSWGHGIEYMLDSGIALYPATVNASSIRPKGGYLQTNTTTITYDLPSTQEAVENTFKSGILFAYAKIDSKTEFAANQAKLNFKNGCALIKITLPSDANDIVSVVVKSASADLAGEKRITDMEKNTQMPNFSDAGYLSELTAVSSKGEITLSAPTGEKLKAGASYYIVAWPGTHSSGLEFTFTNSEGLTLTKTVSSEVVLKASKIDHFNFKNSISFEHIFEVSTESIDIEGEAGNGTFTITSSRDWTAKSNSDWLTINPTSGSSSASAATISYVVTKNPSAKERNTTITITAGEDTKEVTVTQAGFVVKLSIERYGSWTELNATDDFQFVTIKANTDWTLSCDADWLTLSLKSGYATSGETVMLQPTDNYTGTARTTTLYLRDSGNTVEKTFAVTQQPKPLSFKITGAAVDGASDLKDGQMYVICNRSDASLYWSESGGKLVKASLSTSSTFSSNNVFVFHKDESLVTDAYVSAIPYTSRNGGRFTSLSTGKYMDSSFGLNADLSGAQAFLFGNKWAYDGNAANAETGGEIDIIKGPWSGSEISIVYENSAFVFMANDDVKGGVKTRKWVFYEVTEQ